MRFTLSARPFAPSFVAVPSALSIRLVHQIALVLVATVLIAVGAMAAISVVNLERGFIAYVGTRHEKAAAGDPHRLSPDDITFLRAQYLRIFGGAGALLLLTVCIAPLIARRITRPIRAITAATEQITRGDLAVDLRTTRRDEIGTLMQNVSSMARSLGRLGQARRRWIAEIAHELRTPLSILQSELEALAVGVRPLDPGAVGSLQEEVLRLSHLVSDLHQLALSDLDALPCTMGAADLADIARHVTAGLLDRATAKGLTIALDIPAQPVALVADARRLEQLMTNLIENSIRYTDVPGCIAVRVATQQTGVELRVEDSAPGIAGGDCERLFDPLFRGDTARSRKTGGSGLGLAICRAIVRAHRGDVTAAPSPLGGLRVTATLPAIPPVRAAA